MLRARGNTVAVVAVDPTSPFTGEIACVAGRSHPHGIQVALDPGVYIRSMAARGSLGGLATTTREVCDVLDAAGFDRILIEYGTGCRSVETRRRSLRRFADCSRPGTGIGRRDPNPQVGVSWRSATCSWSASRIARAPIA